jgi:hypothetical protein
LRTHIVELQPERMLLWLRQIQEAGIEQRVKMRPANHELPQENRQFLASIRIIGRRKILLEQLITSGIRLPQELEIWIKLLDRIENRRPSDSPIMFRHQRPARHGCVPAVVFDGLRFVQHHAEPFDAVQDAAFLLEVLRPPFVFLLGGDEFGGDDGFGIGFGDFVVGG